MLKRFLAITLAVAVIVAFSLPALAEEAVKEVAKEVVKETVVKGKVEALDKEGMKITIDSTSYSLSPDAAKAEIAAGDEVQATIDNGTVKAISKTTPPKQ